MAAAWLLVVALAQRARCVPHPSTAGVDLYEAIGASRGAATEALLADHAAAVAATMPALEAAASDVVDEATAAFEAHDAALAAVDEALLVARRKRLEVNAELDAAAKALRAATLALNRSAEGGPLADALETYATAYNLTAKLVDDAVKGGTKLRLKKSDPKLNAKLEANVTRALLGVSLSPGANATLKRAFDALRWDRSPKDRWDAVLTVDDFLDGGEPRLSRAAIAALGPIDWSQPLDPLRVERDAERKRLNAYFDYEGPGGISYAKFQAAVLRKVAHLDAGAVDGFVAAIAFADPAVKPGNVTADSARALLDLVNDTAVSIEDPERWTDRRSLLDVEGPPAAASLAESIRASCVQLEAVPPLLARAERLEDDAAELRLAAEAKLADADAAGLAADAALERARAPVAALEQRGRVLDAARETLGDPERRARYDAPCRPSRDAPGCCARALPSGGVELECAAPAGG